MNKKSFYFKDYNYSPQSKSRLNISEDRIYLLFCIFCLISIFSIKIFLTSLQKPNLNNNRNHYSAIFKPVRNDINDRNGEIAKNIRVYHAAIKPNLIKNKKNFILKLQLMYPQMDIEVVKKNLKK